MTLVEFIKLMTRHIRLLIAVALVTGGAVLFLTRNDKKQYTSQMVINTGVVSRYNIEKHNSDNRVDRDYTLNELENIISLASAYETTEELGLRLLARYLMLEEADPEWITAENFPEVSNIIPPGLEAEIIDTSFQATVERLREVRGRDQQNPVYELLYSDHELFGIEQLQGVKVVRKRASDLLEFTYTTIDPAVCQQTLSLLAEVITEKHRKLKEGQSEDVLSFFEKATQEAGARLKRAEEKLLDFRVENKIINYYEQTRFIADKKENLDELFFKETMDLEATQSTLHRLEEQLQNRGKLVQLNQLLLDRRAEISKITDRLAQHQIRSVEADKMDPNVIQSLENRLRQLKGEISSFAKEAYFFEQTPEGLASDDLLTAWLKAVIQLERVSSRLEVIRQRKIEFTEIYSQFAPWGSRLKKIEREIALAEDAYLENLQSYNQARLHLQNTMMSANLQLMDAPYYPTQEQASKRIILTVAAFLAGFILSLAVVVLLEFLDQTLKRPLEAAEKLGLSLMGVFPVFPIANSRRLANMDFPKIRSQATNLLAQNLELATRGIDERPKIVLMTSTRGGEGTSFLAGLLAEHLRAQSLSVLFFRFSRPKLEGVPFVAPHPDNRVVSIDEQHPPGSSPFSFLLEQTEDIESYHYILAEVPNLLSGRYPLELAARADAALLVCRANRTWTSADTKSLNTFEEALAKKPGLIVNGAPLGTIEDFIGELPRSRSRLRVSIKRLAALNFSSNMKM